MKAQPQPDLFSQPRRYPDAPGHRGVMTSVKAAESVAPRMGAQQMKIARFLHKRGGGATYTEIVAGCSMLAASVCGRMREMVLANPAWVKDSGVTRPTPSGREARVYVLTQTAIDHLNKLERSAS